MITPTEKPLPSRALSEKLAFLNQYRIGGLSFDVPQTCKAMLHETLVIVSLGILTSCVLQFWKIGSLDCGCLAALSVPLGLLLILTALRPAEESITSSVFSLFDGYGIYNPLREKPIFGRFHRIVHNLAFLAMISIVNLTQSLDGVTELRQRQDEIEASLGNKEERMLFSWFLLHWLDLSQNLIGSCALITMLRLTSDLAVQSVSFVTGYNFEEKDRKKSTSKYLQGQKHFSGNRIDSKYNQFFEHQHQNGFRSRIGN